MKRRKNKAVMSWLVSLHTLLMFLRCTTCLHSLLQAACHVLIFPIP